MARPALTYGLGVAGDSAVDQPSIQPPGRAGQAHDRGLVRREEVLQPHLLGALAALVDRDALGETWLVSTGGPQGRAPLPRELQRPVALQAR